MSAAQVPTTDPELDRLVAAVDARCRLRGDFELRSGQRVPEYFDKFLFESDPVLLRRVAERMADLLPADAQILGGLELGGIPIVSVLSGLTGIPAAFVRKQAKAYGTRRLAEGPDLGGQTVTLVEDVITTGGAVRDAAVALRAGGAHVTTVLCAIDRSIPGSEPLADAGIEILSVMTRAMLDRANANRTHHSRT